MNHSQVILKNNPDAVIVNPPKVDSNDPLALDNVIKANQGNIDAVVGYNKAVGDNISSSSDIVDRSWDAAIQNVKEHIKDKTNGKIDLTVNTSPLFDILIDNKINEFMYNVQYKSFKK